MKRIIVYFFKICLSGLIALGVLCLYVSVFDNSGVHIKNSSGATDYKWEPYQRKATTREGFAWLTMDQDGFNNTDITNDIDVLLMGSSHMLDVHTRREDNASSLLNKLTNRSVYNIGMSGHTIYTCIQNLHSACNYYVPQNYIVIETDNIELDVDKMQSVISNVYPEIESYDSGLIYTVQKKLPVIKTLYKAIIDWNNSGKQSSDKIKNNTIEFASSEYERVLERFLYVAKNATEESDIILIIVFHPTTEIDENGELINATDSAALVAFQKACDNNGIVFVDMTPDFEKMYEEDHILAHGFINTAVGSGHLNKYGHKAVAERLAEVIGGEK